MTRNTSAAWLASEITRLEKQMLAANSTPQLGTSSIEDGTLLINQDGTLRGAIGAQSDGTNTFVAYNGPPPPQPTTPTIELLNGGVRVRWDGLWVDGAVTPMDFVRIDIHFIDDLGDNPLEMPPRASIISQGWGDAALPMVPGTYYAVLVAWTLTGQYTASAPSNSFTVDPIVADTSALEAALDTLNDELDAAELDVAAATAAAAAAQIAADAAQADVDAIDISGLTADLAAAAAAVIVAQAAADAAQAAADAAQADVDAIDVSGLTADLATAQSDITSLQGDMTTAQADLATAQADLIAAAADIVSAQTDIDAAELAVAAAAASAASALADAAAAQVTADGKNKIITSTSTASGTAYSDGDVWFRRSGEIIIEQWEFRGGAWVAKTLDNAVIANLNAAKITAGTLDAARIGANSITAAKIAAGTITATEIAAGTITAAKIATDTITANEIAAGAIATSELAAGAVTAAKITAGTITATEIAALTITGAQIAAGTITAAKIQAATITASEIAALTITGSLIAANTITAAKIAAGTITASEIAAGTITATQIAANTITAAKIAAGTITTTEIAANTIVAGDIAAGTITTTEIAAATIIAANIAAATITGAKIAANTITAANIAADTITANEIAADAITANEIAAGAVTATQIAAGAVTADSLAVGAVTADKLESQLVLGGEIATGLSGTERVGMNTLGFFSETAAGARKVDIPATGDATFSGDLQADSATFLNGFESRGAAAIASGGSVVLADRQADPGSSPIGWSWRDTVQLATATRPSGALDSTPTAVANPVWDSANNRWIVAATWKISSTADRIYFYQDVSPFGDGTWVSSGVNVSRSFDITSFQAVIHGTRVLTFLGTQTGGDAVFIYGWLLSNLTAADSSTPVQINITNVLGMAVGSDGTDLIFAKIAPTAAVHEGVTIGSQWDMYAHRRPIGGLGGTITLGSISQSWDLNQGVTNSAGGNRKLASVLCARSGATVTFDYSSVISTKALTSNVATLGTAEPHQFIVGDSVTVAGVDATFNGTFTITAVTASTFSYAKVAANVVQAAATGTTVYASSHVLILSTRTGSEFGFGLRHMAMTASDATGPTNATFRGGWYGGTDGLAWKNDDAYLYGYDQGNHRLEKQQHNKASGTYPLSYTLTDDDATGSRHESNRSPEYNLGVWARSKTTVQSAPIPSPASPTTDDPHGVRFYIRHPSSTNVVARAWRVGTGNGFVSATYGFAGQLTIDDQMPFNTDAPAYSVDTGLTRAPSSNSFPTGGAPAAVTSQTGGYRVAGDGSGIWPSQQLIHYTREHNGAQTLTTAVALKITFPLLVEGGSGSATDWSAYFSYSAGDFTILVAGYYRIFASLGIAFNAAAGYRDLQLVVGGNTVKQVTQAPPTATRGFFAEISDDLYVAANSVVQLFATQTGAATLATLATSKLSQFKITRLGAR